MKQIESKQLSSGQRPGDLFVSGLFRYGKAMKKEKNNPDHMIDGSKSAGSRPGQSKSARSSDSIRKKRSGWSKRLLVWGLAILVLGCASLVWQVSPSLLYPCAAADHSGEYSPAVQDIVRRAKDQELITWTPKKDIAGWKENMIYKAGETYQGIPYGQPVDAAYIGWDASLEDFANAVADENSPMYSARSQMIAVAPYYSTDCSAFVSWAWGLPSRQTTWTIPEFGDLVSTDNYAEAQIGDCILNENRHVVLITDIERNASGSIMAMEITEAAPKSLFSKDGTIQTTRYGTGSWHSLYEVQLRYFNAGYSLWRLKE